MLTAPPPIVPLSEEMVALSPSSLIVPFRALMPEVDGAAHLKVRGLSLQPKSLQGEVAGGIADFNRVCVRKFQGGEFDLKLLNLAASGQLLRVFERTGHPDGATG